MFGRIFCERIQLIISYYIHTFLLKEALYRRCNNNQIGWNILCVLFVVTHVSSVLWYSSYYIKYLFLLVYKKVLNFTSIIIVHIYSHTPYTFIWNILTFIHFFVNSIHKNLSIEYYYIFFTFTTPLSSLLFSALLQLFHLQWLHTWCIRDIYLRALR